MTIISTSRPPEHVHISDIGLLGYSRSVMIESNSIESLNGQFEKSPTKTSRYKLSRPYWMRFALMLSSLSRTLCLTLVGFVFPWSIM